MIKTMQYDLADIDLIAQKLWSDCAGSQIITLTGSLGAGKTTLTSALLRHLGVQEPVISPTFTYVNIYHLADGRTVYHFDLYRLKNMQEFEQAGFFEYLYQPDSLVVIEWPEILLPVLKNKVCHVQISSVDQTKRQIKSEIIL